MGKRISKLKRWYEYHERKISIISLVIGFVIDSLTLQNIDNLYDNLWIAGHLVITGFCIIMLNRHAKGAEAEEEGFWLPNILQFSIGALLGSIFVFYLRSSTLAVSWPFVALILVALLANEFFQKRYARLAFQLSFLYFSLFSFSIFLLPILFNIIGPQIFILSGLASLVVIWLYVRLLNLTARERLLESRTHIWVLIALIYIGINTLYFTNLIPPIPLSLQEGGIYQNIVKQNDGSYVLYDEKRGPERYFTFWPKVHWQVGEPLYLYSAVYAPGTIRTEIYHNWQYQNAQGEWVSATKIPLTLSGGRSGGFRTFSAKYNFTPGRWRVDVTTSRGQIIGRINFEIVEDATKPTLVKLVR